MKKQKEEKKEEFILESVSKREKGGNIRRYNEYWTVFRYYRPSEQII